MSLRPGRQNRSHFLVKDHSEPSLQAGCRTLGQSASIPRASPLVQELLPDGPGQKADQRVLLQRVVQKLLKVVYLRGHIQDQLTSRPGSMTRLMQYMHHLLGSGLSVPIFSFCCLYRISKAYFIVTT